MQDSFENITANEVYVPGGPDVPETDVVKADPEGELAAQRKLHKLQDWWYEARTSQADNRFDQAVDDDFVDGIQYSDEDAQVLQERGQAPLVFNEILPAVQWVLGTEKRTRVDYNVLPRTDDDREDAQTKTKLLKYVDDVNKATFARSRAFEHAVRTGVGWLEIGIRADSEKEPLFLRSESWRNVWYDQLSVEPDLSDARYLFRSKIVDLDVAISMWPDSEAELKHASGSREQLAAQAEEDYYDAALYQSLGESGSINVSDAFGATQGRREVVRLVECWYREPVNVGIIRGVPKFDGKVFDEEDPDMVDAAQNGYATVYSAVRMQVRLAMLIEGGASLQDIESPYDHNRFGLVPVWGYRRGRDNAPYGIVRNARDPQDDLNKRRSKALFMLSTNRTIMDEGAVDDIDEYEEEVARPNAVIVKKPNKELSIENNVQLAEEHIMLAQQDAEYVRQSAGVTGENLGHDTNATSGKAILAKQNQGSVTTATLFDNLRLAMQLVGEIELSLIEQFYSDEKIVRISGDRGDMQFVPVNQMQPDGTVLNDITESQADFKVSEQDYRESVRMAMFEQMMDMISKLDSETAMQMLDLVFEWSDLPGKDEMVRRIRQINGQPDPDDPDAQAKADEALAKRSEEQSRNSEAARRTEEAKASKDEAWAAKHKADAKKTNLESVTEALQAALQLLQAPGAADIAQGLLKGEAEPRKIAPAEPQPQQNEAFIDG